MAADARAARRASSTTATRCSTRSRRGRCRGWRVVDGFALGGIYELALACRGIIATEKSTVGFPEIRLNIFPGLGGTQRMPRRSGLVNATDPINGDAGFTAVLQGKNFTAMEAAAIDMVDAVDSRRRTTSIAFAERFLLETLPTIDRTPPPDLANAEALQADGAADDREGHHGPPESARAVRRARRDGQGRGAAARKTRSSSSATPSSTSPPRPRARPACASSSPSSRCRSCRRASRARRAR